MWTRIASINACFLARSIACSAALCGLFAGGKRGFAERPTAFAVATSPSSDTSPRRSDAPLAVAVGAAETDPERLAGRVLLLALHDAVWGPAILCDVRQRIEFDGLQLNGIGKYVREGKGTGRIKLHLQFPGRSGAHALLQISDGHRLHTVEQLGVDRRNAVVDLDQIRERLQITPTSVAQPLTALYLAVGGPAESLRKIYGQYALDRVEVVDEPGTRLWILGGKLRRTPPVPQPVAPIDQQLIALNESAAMPSEVQLRIRQRLGEGEQGMPSFWFEQAEFSRPETAGGILKAFRTRVEWDAPRPLAVPLEPALFEYHAASRSVEDETPRYLPPQPVAVADRHRPAGAPAELLPR